MHRQKWSVLVRLAPILAFPLLSGASCLGVPDVTESIDKINQTMQNAVDMLGQQSSAWQATLTNLEDQLNRHARDMEQQVAADVHDLVVQVQGVAKDGLQLTQESINCQSDIVSAHARIALQNALNRFLNKYAYKGVSNRPMEPFQPTVCTVNPNSVQVAKWDMSVQLILSGTDFNLFESKPPEVVLVEEGGPEVRVPANLVSPMTNYRLGINVPVMVQTNLFTLNSRQIVIRWNGRKVNPNVIPVVPAAPGPSCGAGGQVCCAFNHCNEGACIGGVCLASKTVMATSAPDHHPSVVASLPAGWVLVGGGCRANYAGVGQLLTASMPSGNGWRCESSDHLQPDVATVTAWAIGLPSSMGLDVRLVSATGNSGAAPVATATLPAGYTLVAGGCKDNWTPPGNLLTGSFPSGASWSCHGHDHLSPSHASMTVWAIGIRSTQIDATTATADSGTGAHPTAQAMPPSTAGVVVGGGCLDHHGSPGNMLTASHPLPGGSGWKCAGKDHIDPSPAWITAYAIAIVPRR